MLECCKCEPFRYFLLSLVLIQSGPSFWEIKIILFGGGMTPTPAPAIIHENVCSSLTISNYPFLTCHVKPSFALVTIIDEVLAQNSKIIFTIT